MTFAAKSFVTKTAAVVLTAVTLATATLASTAPASAGPWHHHHHGYGWGAGGLAAGLLVGGLIASQAQPVYESAPVRRCYTVDRLNRWGDVIGTRRVCRIED